MPREESQRAILGAMVPLDTTAKAAALQTQILRKLSPAQRLGLAIDMSEFAHDLALLRLKTQFPQVSDKELRIRLALSHKQ